MKLYKTVTECQEIEEIKTREFTIEDIKNIMDYHNGKPNSDFCITILIDDNPKLQTFIQICGATLGNESKQFVFVDSLFLFPELNERKPYYVVSQGEALMQYQDNFLEKMIGKQVVDLPDELDDFSPLGISVPDFLEQEIWKRYGFLESTKCDIDFLDNYR